VRHEASRSHARDAGGSTSDYCRCGSARTGGRRRCTDFLGDRTSASYATGPSEESGSGGRNSAAPTQARHMERLGCSSRGSSAGPMGASPLIFVCTRQISIRLRPLLQPGPTAGFSATRITPARELHRGRPEPAIRLALVRSAAISKAAARSRAIPTVETAGPAPDGHVQAASLKAEVAVCCSQYGSGQSRSRLVRRFMGEPAHGGCFHSPCSCKYAVPSGQPRKIEPTDDSRRISEPPRSSRG
jgi:hypothetical protein